MGAVQGSTPFAGSLLARLKTIMSVTAKRALPLPMEAK